METVFTRIIKGEIPSFKIAEDENFYAFLDINPIAKGHTLVVPKKEVDYIFDLDDDTLAGLHLFAKRVAQAIKNAVPCKRVGIVTIGMEVPHAHIHLIPLNKETDANFSNPKLKVEAIEMQEIADNIKKNFK